MSTEDEPLSAVATPQTAPATPGLDPATFDMNAFIQGVRPTRRSVRLHLRADLLAGLDEIVAEIDATEGDVDHLIRDYEATRAAFFADFQTWTVERRSSDWVKEVWAQTAARLNVPLNKDGDTDDMKARAVLVQHQLAGQVVEIKDRDGKVIATSVTVEQLDALRATNEGEWNRLAIAMSECNLITAAASEVLTRDFSRRSSTGRSGTAS